MCVLFVFLTCSFLFFRELLHYQLLLLAIDSEAACTWIDFIWFDWCLHLVSYFFLIFVFVFLYSFRFIFALLWFAHCKNYKFLQHINLNYTKMSAQVACNECSALMGIANVPVAYFIYLLLFIFFSSFFLYRTYSSYIILFFCQVKKELGK